MSREDCTWQQIREPDAARHHDQDPCERQQDSSLGVERVVVVELLLTLLHRHPEQQIQRREVGPWAGTCLSRSAPPWQP